ncbi:MAG TPA: monovalent cation/H+ antiporter subunit A [Burkholderiales bacterium]|nr:monovalent cation/H+ antiporter subunit A [Burkholderiales bacterium]
MSSEWLLAVLLALPFLGSVAAALFPPNARNAEATLAAAVMFACLALTLAQYGAPARVDLPWLPAHGVDFVVRIDGLAWMFCALVCGIGFLVVLYARYYMSPRDPIARFYSLLLAFMGCMLGTVLSGNLVQLVFFWEATSLLSFLLVGYWHQNAAARDGARIALVITSAGGLCLFGGVLLLGQIAGSYDLEAVLASGDLIRADPAYVPALALIAVGALTKSAQFPFHFWLPQAMAAPTPVSAYLHSATMVKLGVFLLARLWPALAGTDAWMWIIGTTGLLTLVLGAYAAIFQHDLKGLLAYSTISHLGLVTVLLGLNSRLALVAALFHVMNHATFKASLFMTAGIIDHETGTRDIRRLNGLYRFMPVTATLAVVAAAAMAGVPLLNGFLSKEMFFAEALAVEGPVPLLNRALPYVAVAWGMFSVAYSLRFIHGVFFGPRPQGLPREPHEPPRWMRFPMELLVAACLLVGVLPALTIGPVLDAAVASVLGADAPEYSLAVWHGFTTPMMMSLAALAGGALLYMALRNYIARGREATPLLPPVEGRRVFDLAMATLSWRWARLALQALGTQRLQPQLRWVVVAALVAAGWPVYGRGLEWGPLPLTEIHWAFLLMWIAGAACALGAAWQAKFHRLAAIVLMGGAGVVVCLTFVWLGAADLALTQLLVEVVTTVLLLLGLRWLPKRVPFEPTRSGALKALPRRSRDLALAILSGAGLAALAYAVMTRPLPDSVSRFFLEQALPGGGGTNVVNVIIVDFRGFDTLGEIGVLGVVAITVYALLRRFRPPPESFEAQPPAARPHAEDLLVPRVLIRLMFPLIALFAAHLLLRGHDLPGGGFVAGLTLSIAFILVYLGEGAQWTEDRLAIRPLRWIAVGILVATATGAGSWLFAHAFLTSHTAHLGGLHLQSALFFDVGVFALVVGATALILIALAHQSTRAQRWS